MRPAPLATCAVLLRDYEKVRALYQQALEISETIRNGPEIALIRFQLAELLVDS